MKKSVSGQMAFGAVKGAAEGAASGWLESKATGAKSQKKTKKNMLSLNSAFFRDKSERKEQRK